MGHPNQIVGNIGLFYACYRLCALGWNAMPTSRNARGIDVICLNMEASRMLTFQIKAFTKVASVPLGKSLDGVIGDFWIIVNDVVSDAPKSYIMLPHEIRTLARRGGTYGGPSRWWLRPCSYAVSDFLEKWDRIGPG